MSSEIISAIRITMSSTSQLSYLIGKTLATDCEAFGRFGVPARPTSAAAVAGAGFPDSLLSLNCRRFAVGDTNDVGCMYVGGLDAPDTACTKDAADVKGLVNGAFPSREGPSAFSLGFAARGDGSDASVIGLYWVEASAYEAIRTAGDAAT